MNQVIGHMRAINLFVGGKSIRIGVLRGFRTTPLIEAPNAVQKFNEEYETNVRLVQPQTASFLQFMRVLLRKVAGPFPVPVGAIIAYEGPGIKLGDEIVYANEGEPTIRISTGEHRGKRDIALVAMDVTAKDIQKDGNDYIVVPEKELIVVPDFPSEDGSYRLHPQTAVPCGKKLNDSEGKYYLLRKAQSFVGLPVRDDIYNFGGCTQFFLVKDNPSDQFGVVVEIPQKDLETVSSISQNEQTKKEQDFASLGVSSQELNHLIPAAEDSLKKLSSIASPDLLAPLEQLLKALKK